LPYCKGVEVGVRVRVGVRVGVGERYGVDVRAGNVTVEEGVDGTVGRPVSVAEGEFAGVIVGALA